CNTQSQR
ncbi:hypothetical protein D046_5345B, partial [Vibrio parahaemolyticus V-223/04]